jgi:hypothetical protein
MVNALKRVIRSVHHWLHRHHTILVVILAMIHIGLAIIPAWDSGRVNL